VKVTLELDEAVARQMADFMEANRMSDWAQMIEARLPEPKPDDPGEFGSVVRAAIGPDSDRMLWVRATSGAWIGEGRAAVGGYALLSDVEVLRVGVGTASKVSDAELLVAIGWRKPDGQPDATRILAAIRDLYEGGQPGE
jgi:hypothetical protein